jgi:Calreticulin family
MKLLKDNKALQSEEFSNASPYVIMFGPDKCGATNKVSLAACYAYLWFSLSPGSLHFQAQES